MKQRAGILAVFVIILTLLLSYSYEKRIGFFKCQNYYTRAQAAKMLVLLQESEETVKQAKKSIKFSDVSSENWAFFYIQEAVRLHYMQANKGCFYPEKAFTCRDFAKVIQQFGISNHTYNIDVTSDEPLDAAVFLQFFKTIQEQKTTDIERKAVYVYHWEEKTGELVTDQGSFVMKGFSGLSYERKCITMYVQNNVVIVIEGITKEKMTLKNVFCVVCDSSGVLVDIAGKQFKMPGQIAQNQWCKNVVADITLENGQIQNVTANTIKDRRIRVLLKTTGFQSDVHRVVVVTSDEKFELCYGKQKQQYEAGAVVKIKAKDKRLQNQKLKIRTVSDTGKIVIRSLKRGYGNPAYRGCLEIIRKKQGLAIINELGVEQYLYAVVPSEMPVSYGEEALKVQAVCARSFAYSQMMSLKNNQKEADVDDSVASQVYNNAAETKQSCAAVEATKGQVLKYKGKIVTTYFFSTSCGYTADSGDIWISGSKTPRYLKGKIQAETSAIPQMNLQSEKAFRAFLDHPEASDYYEKNCPWFRWKITMKEKQLNQSVAAHLSQVKKAVKVKEKSRRYNKAAFSDIGKIRAIKVTKRSRCGVIMKLLITGSKATIEVTGEYAVRTVLGTQEAVVVAQDGTKANMAILPSGYFYVEPVRNAKGVIKAYIFAGGGYGHGAGMSQNGVYAMTQRGYSYIDIVKHFYEGAALEQLNW